MTLRRQLLLSLGVWGLFSCVASAQPASTVLPYRAFGPQAMAYETLGFDWWQWQPHGDSRPRDYDVRIVVYCHASQEEISRTFPVDPQAQKDYRYIRYDEALRYLDANIAEDLDPDLTKELAGTRQRLTELLPSCAQ